jgi:hypothetical protein
MKSPLLYLVLASSIAFNVGFAGSLVHKYFFCDTEPALPELTRETSHASEFKARCDQLANDLEPLRRLQAEDSRLLAGLLAAQDPNSREIASCLDRLTVTARKVQGLVVDSVLAQKLMLPQAERAEFCDQVHLSLCKPWGGCRTDSCSLCDNN